MGVVTAKYGNFRLGIDNLSPDHSLASIAKTGEQSARDIVNWLILKDGSLESRPGHSVAQAFAGAHSLWHHPSAGTFLVRSSVLYQVTSLAPYTEALVKVLSTDDRMSYAYAGGGVWASNGTDIGRVSSGAWLAHAMPTPSAGGVVAGAGSLPPGEYIVAVTYSTTAGIEGGPKRWSIKLSATGGIDVTLPGAATGADNVNVYCTKVNGGLPLLATTLAAATANYTVTTEPAGRSLATDGLAPLPAGRLSLFNGRLISAIGAVAYISEPYNFGHHDPIGGYIPFPAALCVVAPVVDGVYFVADKTYFLAGGNPATAEQMVEVAPYGASAWSEFFDPSSKTVGWFSDVGVVLAGNGGELRAVQFDHMATDTADTAATVIVETHGARYVFASLSGNVTPSKRVSSDVQ